jgi:hypothetical protein
MAKVQTEPSWFGAIPLRKVLLTLLALQAGVGVLLYFIKR